jgi:hypothetical protein
VPIRRWEITVKSAEHKYSFPEVYREEVLLKVELPAALEVSPRILYLHFTVNVGPWGG